MRLSKRQKLNQLRSTAQHAFYGKMQSPELVQPSRTNHDAASLHLSATLNPSSISSRFFAADPNENFRRFIRPPQRLVKSRDAFSLLLFPPRPFAGPTSPLNGLGSSSTLLWSHRFTIHTGFNFNFPSILDISVPSTFWRSTAMAKATSRSLTGNVSFPSSMLPKSKFVTHWYHSLLRTTTVSTGTPHLTLRARRRQQLGMQARIDLNDET